MKEYILDSFEIHDSHPPERTLGVKEMEHQLYECSFSDNFNRMEKQISCNLMGIYETKTLHQETPALRNRLT